MATLTIALPDGLKDWAEAQSRDGRFEDVADYVSDLIRKDQERRRWIENTQKLIDEGLASGVSTRSMDEVLTEARRRRRRSAWLIGRLRAPSGTSATSNFSESRHSALNRPSVTRPVFALLSRRSRLSR